MARITLISFALVALLAGINVAVGNLSPWLGVPVAWAALNAVIVLGCMRWHQATRQPALRRSRPYHRRGERMIFLDA